MQYEKEGNTFATKRTLIFCNIPINKLFDKLFIYTHKCASFLHT